MSFFIRKFDQIISRSKFVKSVTVLAGGTALSHGLIAISSPLLTRFYSPEDFGILAVYSAICSSLLVLISLRYELAIPLPEDGKSALNLLVLSLTIVVGISVIVGCVVWIFGNDISKWLNSSYLGYYLYLLPVSLLGGGIYQSLNYWMTRKREFSAISITKGLQSISQVSLQIIGGLFKFGSIGLIVGFISSHLIGIFYLLRRSKLRFDEVNSKDIVKVAKDYKNFALFTSWASLINVIGLQAPSIFFTKYFSLEVTGFFSLTMRVLGIPAVLIGQSVSQVFYPIIAEKNKEPQGEVNLIKQVSTSLFAISFAIFSVVAIHGPELFTILFGDYWRESGRFAQFLFPWFIFSFISSPLSTFVLVKGKQRQALLMTFYETSLRFTAIYLGSIYGSIELAIILFSITGFLISLVYVAWIFHLSNSNLFSWLSEIKLFLLIAILIFIILIVINQVVSIMVSLFLSISTLGFYSIWLIKSAKELILKKS